MAVSEIAKCVGAQVTTAKLVPILMDLIKDDNAEVRLNVVQNLLKVS